MFATAWYFTRERHSKSKFQHGHHETEENFDEGINKEVEEKEIERGERKFFKKLSKSCYDNNHFKKSFQQAPILAK